jgi:transcription elongation factor Elf1
VLYDLFWKELNTIQNKVSNRESGSVEITSRLFVCPKCGKQSFSIHRKTYENIVIAFCGNCHLNSSFEPSREANYDPNRSWEEFAANYKIRQINTLKS